MSATAIPKPGGARPPFLPPTKTGFDGTPSGEPEPVINRIAESVYRLLKTVDHTQEDRLDTLLSLLQQRKMWVASELSMERELSDESLPPFDFFSLEYLFEPSSRAENRYVLLLNQLDEAIEKVSARIRTLNRSVDTSDL